ncbi:MAG TPA: hypothetical protein VLD37_05305 [Candidatus Bilamarchaeum sp.]|nr:hypothetical protein [Candidatus Bilamarchaeum sp.]
MTDNADPTGMKHAQTREVGRARAMAQAAWSRVPFTQARKERLHRDAGDKAAVEEEARLRARKRNEEETKRSETRVDTGSVEGGEFPVFRNALMDAIRRGQSRSSETSDMMIREVVCSDAFIQAIDTIMIRTPLEEVEVEYQKQMRKIRDSLVSELKKAKESSDYTMAKLSTHEMDIVLHTMIGFAPLWASTVFPPDMLKPPEAFLRFLETVALRERHGTEGEFIGKVLKNMAAMRTITSATDRHAPRELVDVAYINSYLSRKSAEPVERAVADFTQSVQQLLETPEDEVCPATGTPGHGLVPKMMAGLEERIQTVTEAQGRMETAKDAQTEKNGAKDKAKAEMDKVADYKRRADAKRDKIADADYQKIVTALETETAKYEAAKAEAEAASGEFGTAVREYNEAVADAKAYKREMEARVELTKKDAAGLFRPEASKGNATADSVADAMADTLINQHVIDVVDHVDRTIGKWKEYGRLSNTEFEGFVERVEDILDRKDALGRLKEKYVEGVAAKISAKDLESLEGDITTLRRDIEGSTLAPELRTPLLQVMDPLGNMGYPRESIDKKIEAVYYEQNVIHVEEIIAAAAVPDATKAELRSAVARVKKKGAGEEFTASVQRIKETHGQPLRKAAKMAVEKMAKNRSGSPIGITDQQWAKAYEVWTSSSNEPEGQLMQEESKWAKFKNWFSRRFGIFSDESFYRAITRGLWNSVKNDVTDLYPPNMFQPTYDKRLDNKQKIKNRYWPRVFRGATSLLIKVWIVGSIYQYAAGPAGFVDHFIYDERGGNHWYNKARWPFEWWTQVQRPRQVRRVVHDHYDIPERLADSSMRPDSYYRSQYGVGTRRLEGETDDTGRNARLQWLRGRPEVLRYFQERTLTPDRQVPKRMDSWRRLEETPDTCSTSQRQIPRSCENLGLRTPQAVMDYRPVDTNDAWRQDAPVCCLIEIRETPIADGLLINPVQSDRFVKVLMDQDRGGVRVDYEYLSRVESRLRWVNESFLISPREYTTIRDYRVTARDNIQFIMTQGDAATGPLAPMTRRADAPNFIPEEGRDAFVTLWRETIVSQRSGSNPAQEQIPADVMTSSLQAAITAGRARQPPIVLDVTTEYERRQILIPFESLELQTDTAKDVLVAQQDIRDLVRQFIPSSSTYSINVGRADDFVQVIAQHRMRGGQAADFSPFTSPMGSRVQWAVSMDFIRAREQFRPDGTSSAVPAGSGSATAQAAPDMGPAADRFFSSPNSQTLRDYVDGMMVRLQSDRTGQRVMRTALSSRYGGNEETMRRAVRTEIFRFLSSGLAPEVQERGQWGITVSGAGESMQVTVNDRARFVEQLQNHIVAFLGRRQ